MLGRVVGIKRRLLSFPIKWRFAFFVLFYIFIGYMHSGWSFGAVSSKEVTWLLGFAKLGCMDGVCGRRSPKVVYIYIAMGGFSRLFMISGAGTDGTYRALAHH